MILSPTAVFVSRINNCVGEDNHWLFLQLCFYTQVLSLFTLVLDFCQYYYFQPLTSLDQVPFTGIKDFVTSTNIVLSDPLFLFESTCLFSGC